MKRFVLISLACALGAASLLGLAGCAEPLRHADSGGSRQPPEPVDLSLGILFADHVPGFIEHVATGMEGTNLFRSVETVKSKRAQGIDVFVNIETTSCSPKVTASSAYSQRVLYTGRPPCGWNDWLGVNVQAVALDLARAFASGGGLYEKIAAEKLAANPPAPAAAQAPTAAPAPVRVEPSIQSDVDSPGYKLAEKPDHFALVVGIGSYKNLPEAKFAARDAEAMREHLLAMGYPRRNVVLLTGDNGTRTGLTKYLEEWLPRNVDSGATVFFYYSGHGAPDPKTGEAFLVPWDGDAAFLQSTAYPLRQLYAQLGKLKARRVIVALDSCFSGAGGRSVLADGARPLVTKVDTGFAPQGKITLFSAASGDEITGTLPEQGHGMFTYFFLKALSSQVGSGQVSAQALYDSLKPRVQDEARRQNREQTPLLLGTSGSVIGD